MLLAACSSLATDDEPKGCKQNHRHLGDRAIGMAAESAAAPIGRGADRGRRGTTGAGVAPLGDGPTITLGSARAIAATATLGGAATASRSTTSTSRSAAAAGAA